MKWWHVIGLQIALKKMIMALGQGTCKPCRGKSKDYFTAMNGFFSVTILNRQDIDGHLPQMRCLQTKRLKSGIWGHRSFGEGLSWEESSEGLLTCSTAPLAEGDPVFLSLRKKAREIFSAMSHMRHHTKDMAHKEQSKSGSKPSP